MQKIIIPILLFLFLAHSISAQIADKVFKNAKIYTTNNTFEEAIAFLEDEIIYVGTDAGVNVHIGGGTSVEDLEGKLVLPGMHDVHMHPLEAGSPVGGTCVLNPNQANPITVAQQFANCNPPVNSNGWIVGFGHSIFTLLDPIPYTATYPKQMLDAHFPNQNVVIMEETSHSVWVNSKALTTLGITSSTPDPVGGHIVKDNFNGNVPTGILMDNAGDVALAAALASNASIDAANKSGLTSYSLPLLAENGITSICEGRTYWKRNYHTIWQSIKTDGDLTCRVALAPWAYPEDDNSVLIPALQALYDAGDDMLKTTQVKVYSDGISINATAALHDPYNYSWDLPFTTGLNYIDESRLTSLITTLEQNGFDFHIHAIGDRGTTEALDAIESARTTNGNIGARHRITHLEIVKATDIPRFLTLDVTADMQVAGNFTNPSNWGDINFLVGDSRTDSLIPLKAFHQANARISLSSDWDVSTVNPFAAMKNALTRAPQELPSVEEAVKAYTINAAYVMRQETQTGSLEVGKWADLIVVDRDIFTISTNQIANTKVLLTYVGGEEIYRSSSLPLPVELLYFEIQKEDCEITLEWATASEFNSAKFAIERSSNGKYFEKIGEISAQGFSQQEELYHFIDKNPLRTNYYRLVQIDLDGSQDVTPVIFAKKVCESELDFQISPNITSYLSMVQLVGGADDKILAQLISSNGKLIKEFEITHQNQVSQSPINVTFLPEGVYYLQLYSPKNQFKATKPIIISR